MQRNVVALADDEYDALAAPLVDEACRLIEEIADARAYLLPVIIASLAPYAVGRDAPEGGQSHTPAKALSFHRPHFHIHNPQAGQD
ncbi:MAG: hypothetical protein QGH94_12445 [Phycisphaerae bacterium]|jgi:hypothetical protein|nr:hypothetical protein [Phycisphaerae bacterium]